MNALSRRIAFWSVPVLGFAAAIVYLLLPKPVPVDVIAAAHGPLVVTIAEQGESRVEDVFVFSAPVAGRMRRIEVEAGDLVEAGRTVLAEIEPIDPAFLDVRGEAEAKAAVDTARAAGAFAAAELTQAEADLEFATLELDRARRLFQNANISKRALDEAERAFKTRQAAVATARAAVAMRASELRQAEVHLLSPVETRAQRDDCGCIRIRSPVNGKVLRVLHESEGVVVPGEDLLEIGDPRKLEIRVDFLSVDAVRMAYGQRVIIENWGGDMPLAGRVTRIEPYGYTKVSALGIEEQRVDVVIALTDPEAKWRPLGHGFQVDARVALWESEDVLKLPLTALFREGGEWSVFRAREGIAELRAVTVGHRTDLEAEITDGLAPGDLVLRYPSDSIENGTRVEFR